MKAHTRNNQDNVTSRNMTLLDDDIRVEKNAQGIETYVFDPYNPLNKLISKDEIQKLLKTYGIDTSVQNYELYRRALFTVLI